MKPEPTVGAWLDRGWTVTARCMARGCSHTAELDLIEIADSHGRTLGANTLRHLLRCRRCGARGGLISLEPSTPSPVGRGPG